MISFKKRLSAVVITGAIVIGMNACEMTGMDSVGSIRVGSGSGETQVDFTLDSQEGVTSSLEKALETGQISEEEFKEATDLSKQVEETIDEGFEEAETGTVSKGKKNQILSLYIRGFLKASTKNSSAESKELAASWEKDFPGE